MSADFICFHHCDAMWITFCGYDFQMPVIGYEYLSLPPLSLSHTPSAIEISVFYVFAFFTSLLLFICLSINPALIDDSAVLEKINGSHIFLSTSFFGKSSGEWKKNAHFTTCYSLGRCSIVACIQLVSPRFRCFGFVIRYTRKVVLRKMPQKTTRPTIFEGLLYCHNDEPNGE